MPCENWNNDKTDIIIKAGLVVDCEACYCKANKKKFFQSIQEYILHLHDPNKKVKKLKDRKEATDAIQAKAKSEVKLTKNERVKLTSRENA